MVEIVTSTGHQAVIPALDKMMSVLGIPDVVGTDNGPPFNGHKFEAFAKYMGFKHKLVTPLAPWANGLVKRFMPNLTKVLQIAKEEKRNWRQELHKYLRAYRATPHSTTDYSPAHLLFNGRKYKTRLPNPVAVTRLVDHKQVKDNDIAAKFKMKLYADGKKYVKVRNFQEGDSVLCRQAKENKLTTPYHNQPLKVVRVRGSRITAVRNNGKLLTRHANHFKHFREPEDGDLLNKAEEPPSQPEPAKEVGTHEGPETQPDGVVPADDETSGIPETRETTRPRRRVQMPGRFRDYDMTK